MVKVEWQGGMVFEAVPPSGNRFRMDVLPESGGQNAGPTPLETFLAAGAACSAVDVMLILQKKRQKVTAYHVEIEGERLGSGIYPNPFAKMTFRHVVEGEDIDPAAVETAVKLSDEKYCSVIATLRSAPAITSEFTVREVAAAR